MKKIRLYNIEKLNEKTTINKVHKTKGMILGIGILLASLSVTGCMSSKNNNQTVSIISSQVAAGNETGPVSTETIVNKEFNEKEVTLTNEELTAFEQYINTITTSYTYEDFYGIDLALEKETTHTSPAVPEHTNKISLIDGKFTAETITEQIIENNKKYLSSDNISSYKKASLKELSTNELQSISSIIADTLNKEIEKNKEIDIDEVTCIVADLKVFSSPSSSNAFVNDENCLVISPNMINIAQIMDSKKDAKKDILIHEALHLLQKSCVDNENKEKESKIGISQYWEELKANPLKWNWFYEASAEKEMCNLTGDEAVTYKYLISYLDSLSIATILNDNVEAGQTEALCFQKNPEKLYEQFNSTSLEEKKELIKLMYTIDILQYEREDFYDQYNPVYGKINSEEELVALQRNLKSSVCETLTKEFYKSLAKKMTAEPLCIDDMNYLIRVFEADINSHLDCENKDKAQENIPFMDQYLEIQNNFFQGIADSNQMSLEEVSSQYNEYILQPSEKLLISMDSSKKGFINQRLEDVKNRSTSNISKMRQRVAVETVQKTK